MPGTLVADKLALTLLSLEEQATNATGTAVESGKPAHVAFEAEVGTVTGTDVVCDIEVQGADNSTFNQGVVSYGHFDTITENSDGEVRYLEASVYKPYLRAVATISGTSPKVDVVVKVRDPHYKRTTSRTA